MDKTSNYGMFGFLKQNRPIDDKKVEELVESIKQCNLLHLRPINVTNKLEVIDGQHRLKAAERLRVPIYYTKSEVRGSGTEEIILLQIQNRWGHKDFIHCFAEDGNENYIKLSKFMEKHHLSTKQVLILLDFNTRDKKSIQALKQGKFEFPKDEKKYVERLNNYNIFCEFIRNKSAERFNFKSCVGVSNAFFKMCNIEEMDFEILMKKLALRLDRVKKCVSSMEYFKMFISIYNYKNNQPLNVNMSEYYLG